MTLAGNERALTFERLREMVDYNPKTGVFTWLQRPHKRSRKRVGEGAGTFKIVRGHRYLYIGLDNVSYHASQLAWFWVHGEWPSRNLKFENGNTADLRIANLAEMRTTPNRHDFSTDKGRGSYRREYYQTHREHLKGRQIARYYGVDVGEYQRMLLEQNGVCAICRKPETAVFEGQIKMLAVDHCHDTDAVRGLLCQRCNHGLGHFNDDVEIMKKAVDYIEFHRARADNVVSIKKVNTDG